MKVLILGGYGVFGGRLARLLADCRGIEMLICGRHLQRATDFCNSFRGQARARPLAVDRVAILGTLRAERPAMVVDASGPFQDYGAGRYSVIEACIAEGIDYLDFADAADFVFGVTQFDAAAKAAGVFVLAGVSSFPVLTAAVLREMAKTMEISQVEGGIAPSPYAGIGLNVMRAVVGYAGSQVKLQRDGRPATGIGLAESRRFTIAVPGCLPLRNTRFSLVDVPDLQVLPPEHPAMKDIWIGAGPVPESLHLILNFLARVRSIFRLPSLVPFAGLFYRVLNLMRFGEHRGGMYILGRGRQDGAAVVQSWHLLAEGDDGPLIPSMAIEAILRKCLAGVRPDAGARSAVHALELSDYGKLFEGRAIRAAFRKEPPSGPVFRQVLADAYDALPAEVRALHSGGPTRILTGHARVTRGRGLLSRVVCRAIGFPDSGAKVPVSVVISPLEGRETWTRSFAGKTFSSQLRAGTGRNSALLLERFGLVEVALALVLEGGRLHFAPRGWALCGIRLPQALLPRGRAFETETEGRFRFDVEIALPFAGLIVAYSGDLAESQPA